MNSSTLRFVRDLPKAELYVHLEGCLTPDFAARLARRNNIPLPESVSKASTTEGFAFHDFTTFLAVYYPAMTVLQTSEDFHDLAWDYLSKAAAQSVRYCELFFDPQAHTSRGVQFSAVITGYSSALQREGRELNVSASLIMCFLRDMSPEYAMATLMEALSWKHLIIGVGLDSDERDNPPIKFKAVFERARKEGFMITMHCDIDQKGSIENIRQALMAIGVDRIDHGTNVIEDQSLVEVLKTRGIGLTCCPISNSVVTDDFKGKEILQLLRQGVEVTINSDDPAYFRGYVDENLLKLESGSDVSMGELIQLQRNAFEISWLSSWRKDKYLRELEEYARKHGLSIE